MTAWDLPSRTGGTRLGIFVQCAGTESGYRLWPHWRCWPVCSAKTDGAGGTRGDECLKVQRGQAEASDATLLYHRMLKVLKGRGVEKPAWLTPCEFARVLEEPEVAVLVEDLTSAYNELRFGGNAEAAGRMVVLLERLEAVP